MDWFKTERQKWASPRALAEFEQHIGLTALDAESRELYEVALPRRVQVPRLEPDRERVNGWMPPYELAQHVYVPGQIMLGRFAGHFLSHLDDRRPVTIADPRPGKTSKILERSLYLSP